MAVGQMIRQMRKERELTQAELGVLSGAGPSGISQIETGRRNPSAGTLQRIAEALGVEVRDLFPLGQTPLPEIFSSWERDPVPVSEQERAQMDREALRALERHEAGEPPQAYFVEGIVGAAAEGWLRAVGDSETASATAWGIVTAARDLENQLSVFLGGSDGQGVPGEVLGQFARTMKRLEEVEARYSDRVASELRRGNAPADELAELRRRKEQLEQWKAGKTA